MPRHILFGSVMKLKLLYCPSCHEIFNLGYDEKSCSCASMHGHYESDGLNATYSGIGIPLGFSNNSFKVALLKQNVLNQQEEVPFYGSKFEAWIVPMNSDTFKKVDE